MVVTRVARAVVLLGLVLAAPGCTGTPREDVHAAGAASLPTPGGPSAARRPVPDQRMTRLERAVATVLARRVRAQGLTVDHLDCPAWDGAMPSRLRCTGWVSGVPAAVLVRLHRVAGASVGFDARLGPGVVATRTLVTRLREHGLDHVDCGGAAAYPARVGLRVVCLVGSGAGRRAVVATVTSRAGAVVITGG